MPTPVQTQIPRFNPRIVHPVGKKQLKAARGGVRASGVIGREMRWGIGRRGSVGISGWCVGIARIQGGSGGGRVRGVVMKYCSVESEVNESGVAENAVKSWFSEQALQWRPTNSLIGRIQDILDGELLLCVPLLMLESFP
ncbi:hypothetical protein AKJ16_DCAP25406 [Drosera capensis]